MAKQHEHYFSEKQSTAFTPRKVEIDLQGKTVLVSTAAGVFSPDGIDRGTRVLLRSLDKAPDGNLLDIGSGWGAISLDAAMGNPAARVWAVEVNERSRQLTELNVKDLGLTNITVTTPDDVPTDITFQEIRSNPPIRVGKEVLHEILLRWLPRLAPAGIAYLVVAKNLGANSLAKWIQTTWPDFEVSLHAREKGFHVLKVVSP